MGYIKHHAIIVTHWENKKVEEAHKKAKEIFENKLVSEIVSGIVNTDSSFFIAPDGSKEGWSDSELCNDKRTKFLDWLMNSKDNYSDYVEIQFGGDDDRNEVIRSNDSDL